MRDITWSYDDNQSRFRHEKWRQVFDQQTSTTPLSILTADPLFSLPLGEDSTKYASWLTKEAIWTRYLTLSHIYKLKNDKRLVSFFGNIHLFEDA